MLRSMRQLRNAVYITSLTNDETGKVRIARDSADCNKIKDFFATHNPFMPPNISSSIRNIVSGTLGSLNVNVDDVVSVGEKILADMKDRSVSDYSFKRKSQAVNLSEKIRFSGQNGPADVDPVLLFQRLTAILLSTRQNQTGIDLSGLFSYSLCPYPAALASSSSRMLLPSKSKLMESLIQTCSINDLPDGSYKYVNDGGHLMHTMVPWQKQKTFEEIANRCIEYVIKEYSRNCVIVFDGYPVEPTTKDHAHEYRSEAAGIAPEVQVDPSSRLDLKKEQPQQASFYKPSFTFLQE